MAKDKKNDLIDELNKLVQRKEKKHKKILLSLTEDEHNAVKNVAEKLNTTVSEVVKNTLKLQGLFDTSNTKTKDTKAE